MKRRICVITGTRAEYGLLRWIMEGIKDSPDLELQVIATGTHLSPEFGSTSHDIEADGLPIHRKVEMLMSSDTPVGVAKSMGVGLIGFADAIADLQPDLVLVLGDRFEMLAAVSAAMVAQVPVAHLHGGEVTEGAFDDSIRHAITKMSHLHFVATEEYRRRVIQLGEPPDRVFLVGGLGIDNLLRLKLMDRSSLEASLGMRLKQKSLLVTFHPVTRGGDSSEHQMQELLEALHDLEDTSLIFTMPNADNGSRLLAGMIRAFVKAHKNACAFDSLGQLRYLSCMQHVDGVVGNSSSGLTEAPSFHKGTVNIGDRQRGRLQAASVIDCQPERTAISAALGRLFSPEFQASLGSVRNPYGEGGSSEKVLAILRTYPLETLQRKVFYDIPFDPSLAAINTP